MTITTREALICITGAAMLSGVATAADSESTQLEEVIVTAQKREESQQRIPIAITTIDANRLEKLGITNTVDLAFAVPGLEVTSIVGNFQPYIRGVGNDITQGVDNSVALHIDGVYIPTITVGIQDLVAVDRIEVLKGPQGTLYGRNATGGAINIITKDPDLSDSTETVTAGYGNFDERKFSGYFNVPLASTLAANLAVSYKERDPYNRNLLSDGPGLRNAEDSTVRAKIFYQPMDDFSVLFSATDSTKENDDANAAQQTQSNSIGAYYGGQTSNVPFREYFNDPPRFDSKFQMFSLHAKADFAPFDVVSITAYQGTNAHSAIDFDATDAPIFYFDVHNRSDTFTQEFQVLSKRGSPINWIAGLYYLNGEFQFRPVALVAPPAPSFIYSRDTTQSYAGYGQATLPITDTFSITAGVRYTHEKKAIPLDDLISGSVVTPFGGGPANERVWTKTTPKVSLDYQVLPNILLWASAGRGFKSGGFDAAAPTDLGPVNPEVLDAIEAGVKSDLLDNRLRVNLSLYHYHINDLQVQVVTNSSEGGAVTQNAATAVIQGGELEVSAKVNAHLRLDAGMAVIDGKYTSFDNYAGFLTNAPFPGNTASPQNVTGFPTTRSPKHTFSLGGEFLQPLPSGNLVATALYTYTQRYDFDPAAQSIQHPFGVANATLGYVTENKKLNFTLWGNNLTNKAYLAISNVNALGTFVTYAEPRIYGGTVTYNFH